MSLSTRIKEEGAKNGFTTASIEKQLGLGNGTISKWDLHIPSIDKVWKVANLLNTTIDYLFTGVDVCINNECITDMLTTQEKTLLNLYRTLNQDYKDIIIGDLKKYNTLQKHEETISATASPLTKKQA